METLVGPMTEIPHADSCVTVHCPPRAVLIPLRLNSVAIARRLKSVLTAAPVRKDRLGKRIRRLSVGLCALLLCAG